VSNKQSIKRFSKFADYVLGHRPDEFGLVPDEDGYVKIKDFLKAISEEDGWRHVRRSHIDEIFYTVPDPPIEIQTERIRAGNRGQLPASILQPHPPKLLYTCIRRKAYAHVLEKGITPTALPQVVLSSSRQMAERLGNRIDRSPIVLTVQVEKAIRKNTLFHQVGESLFLADSILPGCFTGPPPPKQKPEPQRKPDSKDAERQKQPGSFQVDIESIGGKVYGQGRKKDLDWKKDRKRIRREKRKPWQG